MDIFLEREYDQVDLQALQALLEYEGCPGALVQHAQGWRLDLKKGRNLLFRHPGDVDWLDLVTVPLWRELVEEAGAEWSEEALRHVARVLVAKSVLLEVDLPDILAGKLIRVTSSRSIHDGFPSVAF